MTLWEIWTWENHPAVIISNPDRAARKQFVEVLACSTSRAHRAPRADEILLDSADGLDWETLVYCDLIYSAERGQIVGPRRGIVTPLRRQALVRTIIQSHGWAGL